MHAHYMALHPTYIQAQKKRPARRPASVLLLAALFLIDLNIRVSNVHELGEILLKPLGEFEVFHPGLALIDSLDLGREGEILTDVELNLNHLLSK
mgnify:FL=1